MTEPSTSSAPESLAKAERLFRLAALLREGQLTVRELALKLYPTALVGAKGWAGIERSIQRDLADLERLEPDYQPPRGRPPRYSIQTHRTQLHLPTGGPRIEAAPPRRGTRRRGFHPALLKVVCQLINKSPRPS